MIRKTRKHLVQNEGLLFEESSPGTNHTAVSRTMIAAPASPHCPGRNRLMFGLPFACLRRASSFPAAARRGLCYVL